MLQPSILTGHSKSVNSSYFLNDGIRLLSCSSDSTLRLWNLELLEETSVFKVDDQVSDCCPQINDNKFVSSDFAKTLKMWDIETGKILWTIVHDGVVTTCSCSRDDKIIASSSNFDHDDKLYLWDGHNGTIIHTYDGLHSSTITCCKFSSISDKLATSSMDGNIQYIDYKNKDILFTLKGHTGVVSSCFFSPCSKKLVSSSWDRSVRTWDLEKNIPDDQRLLDVKKAHFGSISCVTYSPDGKLLASTGYDHCVVLWEPNEEVMLLSLMKHTDWINHCSFSKDQKLATSSSDKSIHIWENLSASTVIPETRSAMFRRLHSQVETIQITELEDSEFSFLEDEIILPTIVHEPTYESGSD